MSKRIPLWDNVRFLLILSVVVGHFAIDADAYSPHFLTIVLFIYSFHMPGFFLLAGMFHRNTGIKRKVLSYFALYLVMKALIVILLLLLGREPHFRLFTEDGLPWFMWAMGCFVLFAWLLRDIDRRVVLVLSVVLACFAGYDESIGDTFVLSRVIVYFPFYLIGMSLPREKLEALNRNSWPVRAAAFAILAIWALLCLFCLDKLYFLRPLFTGRNPFPAGMYPWGPLYRLLCYAISLLLCLCLFLAAPGKEYFFTRFGGKTLQIYFWHRVVLYVLVSVGVLRLLGPSLPGKLIWMLLSVCLTLLLGALPLRFPMETVRDLIQRPDRRS